ncbi:hypothetical protein [Priestia megaterium]|uniref:hypothetical protein n=1 Tax=Priestia megaterium TaxID=1404 RepID=UPI000BF7E164|nr:hypothetical protein [Priestia megaterium]PFV93996.1 hypothetical protein COL08_22205 [Priestia megaterium]
MKKWCVALISVLLFISLIGCQSKNEKPLNFSGKGDHWSAKVTVKSNEDKKENKKIKLTYLGNDLDSVGEFEFKLDAPNGQWGMGAIKLDKEGKFEGKSDMNTSEKTSKLDQLVLHIEWNNESEEIVLENK